MSLSDSDFNQIRVLVREETRSIVRNEAEPIYTKLENIEGKLESLENDVREIYEMITELQKSGLLDKSFKNSSLEKKLLKLNSQLLSAAKQAGVTLPR